MSLRARLEAGFARLWWRERACWVSQLLRPLALLYGAAIALRRLAYRSGWRRTERTTVPVVVVGNLVVGGAGKTPAVIALVRALRVAGWTPGIISRGHGRSAEGVAEVNEHSSAADAGDEPLLLRLRTGAPVWVGRRRVEAARALCAAHPAVDVLVSDDGLQHLPLARDVQLAVFDDRGVGNGLLLPAGPLREPLARHVPVNTHVLYNAPRASTRWPGALAQRGLGGAVLLQDWWRGEPASPQQVAALRGRTLLAAAGLAAPQRFFSMLRDAGLQIEPLPLPDHFDYRHLPWPADADDVLVTEKDAVKLPRGGVGRTRVWVVALDFRLPDAFVADVLHNLRLNQRR